MLGDKMVNASIPVTDLDRALDFYQNTLGLKADEKDKGGAMVWAGGGTGIYLYERGPSTADHTLAGFNVDDVESEVAELRDKGVEFEDYDMPDMGIKTEEGIATMGDWKAAWFKDPDGNILSINEM
jgi:catechol 2,3-dioxygenase-like lactoylglutathione lyase family enzyme